MSSRNSMGSLMFTLLLVATAGLFGQGCMTFSPPIQSTHYGAPGRLAPGEMEIRGAGTMHGSGGPGYGFQLIDGLTLEGGADLQLLDRPEKWMVGSLGLRYTMGGKLAGKIMAMDLEAGFGLGVGGAFEDETEESTPKALERFAYGGYLGAGIGAHLFDWGALFARGRVQGSTADGLPATLWWSGIGGVEFTVSVVSLYVAGGIAGFWNDQDDACGGTFEGGVSIHF